MKYRSCKDCPQYEKCVTTSNLAIKRKRCEFADNSRNKKPLTHFDRLKCMDFEEVVHEILYIHSIALNYNNPEYDIRRYLKTEVRDSD